MHLDALLPIQAAGYGAAGAVLFVQRAAFAGGACIQVFAGAGVQAHIAAVGQALHSSFLGVLGRLHLVLPGLDLQLAGVGAPGGALVGDGVGLDFDLGPGQLARLGKAAALVFQALEVVHGHVGANAGRRHGVFRGGLLEARGFFAQHQAFDGAGKVAVLDTGAEAARPVVTALFTFLGILHRAVVDAFGRYLQGVASLDACGLCDQFIAIQLQVAAGLQCAALHLAVAFGLHLAVVMAFEQAAQPVDAASHRQAAATVGGAGGFVAVIAGCPQGHLLGLHIEVACGGLHRGTVDLQVSPAAKAHRGAFELTGGLASGALLAAGGGDVIGNAGRILAGLGLAILGFLGLLGAGAETTLLVAGFVLVNRLRAGNQQVALGLYLQVPARCDLGALDAHFLGAGQAQIGGRADVAGQYLLCTVGALVVAANQAEQLAVAGTVGGGGAAMVGFDGQCTFCAVEQRVLLAVHGTALDGHLVSCHGQLAVRRDTAAGNGLAFAVVTLAVAKEGAGYKVAAIVASGSPLLQGCGTNVCLIGFDCHVAAAVQAAALHIDGILGLERHALGLECTALRGFLVLVGIAVTAPQVLAVANLLFGVLAVDAGSDGQVGAAVECQLIASIHLGSHQAHVVSGLQQHAVLALQAAALLLLLGRGGFAVVGFAGDEQELLVPAVAVALDVLAGCGVQRELLAGLGLDSPSLPIDGFKGQVIGSGQPQIALFAVQFDGVVGLAADLQGAGRLDVDPVDTQQLRCPHTHTGTFCGAHHANAPGAHGTEQAGIDAGRSARQVFEKFAAGAVDAVATDGDID